MLRMEWFVNNYLSSSVSQSTEISILDVGSYNVNGCYKTLLQHPRFLYQGLDMESGPNVDIVAERPYQWPMLKDESFDVVISGQALEHIEFFWLTFSEMCRVLKKGGLMCIIAPRGFPRHRYPVDCYRFDTDGIVALAKYCNLKPLHASMNLAPVGSPPEWYSKNDVTADTMLIAEKPIDWCGAIDPTIYSFKQNDLEKLATGFIEMPKTTDPPSSILANIIAPVQKSVSDELNAKISSQSNSIKEIEAKILAKDNIIKELNAKVSSQGNTIKELSDKISNQDGVTGKIQQTLVAHTKAIDANQRWIIRFRYSYPYRMVRKVRGLFRK